MKVLKNSSSIQEHLAKAKNDSADLGQLSVHLAELLWQEALKSQTIEEKKLAQNLSEMMNDPKGKLFTTAVADQAFRSRDDLRASSQIRYLINYYGMPTFLTSGKRFMLRVFNTLSALLPTLFMPLFYRFIRSETSTLILPGEAKTLDRHLKKRKDEKIRVNLNRLGEAIIGEGDALRRLSLYKDDLENPLVEYISIKISTIYSQNNLVGWDKSLEVLSRRYRELLDIAHKNNFVNSAGKIHPKFVNLDMEEYKDLDLTVALFKKVLSEENYLSHSAGIVLQAYLPDSFALQQQLTEFALSRVAKGGAPLKIRLVKGANLAQEKVEASLRNWPQAPFESKAEVDANFIKMLNYGLQKENIAAMHIGLGSHNIFDMAYGMLLSVKNGITNGLSFELLEGMANPMRRVLQKHAEEVLIYCPVVKKEEFENAVAYLVRRWDENAAEDNFLRHSFDLNPGNLVWQNEAQKFEQSLKDQHLIETYSRRTQSRIFPVTKSRCCFYQAEADTDFSIRENRLWAKGIYHDWKTKKIEKIPFVIGGKEREGSYAMTYDPSSPQEGLLEFCMASLEDCESALEVAVIAFAKFSQWTVEKRATLLRQIAHALRDNRGDLLGMMARNCGKTVVEGDVEISEAIDFAEYYAKNLLDWHRLEHLYFQGKGPTLILPPWNFPCSIPAGGILAALAAGCSVIIKPSLEAVGVAWILVNAFWNAGVPRDVLQFVICKDEPQGSYLVKDARIKNIILTGSSATAKALMKIQGEYKLQGETGGKNAIIVTGLADKDLAIKDVLQSAFGHAGQKCSACSLLILLKEVYDNPHFKKTLKDGAESLSSGSVWDLENKIPSLIGPASPHLHRALTTLEEGEEWLLKPQQDPKNPQLFSPGIKWGVKNKSFTHQTEFFGPLLAVMCANTLEEAIQIANSTPYGLTSGIHTLDPREMAEWTSGIEAGNLYINRTITGAIVNRQPFGGTKDSHYGVGFKAGGPNYITSLMQITEKGSDPLRESYPHEVNYSPHNSHDFQAAIESYTYFWNHYFSLKRDVSRLLGQDNYLFYKPHKKMILRAEKNDSVDDFYKVILACKLTQTPLEISVDPEFSIDDASFVKENESELILRLLEISKPRLRFLRPPSPLLLQILNDLGAYVHQNKVLSHGRVELLNYVREISLSHDYHRYGNLGKREFEERAPLTGCSSRCEKRECCS